MAAVDFSRIDAAAFRLFGVAARFVPKAGAPKDLVAIVNGEGRTFPLGDAGLNGRKVTAQLQAADLDAPPKERDGLEVLEGPFAGTYTVRAPQVGLVGTAYTLDLQKVT